MKKITTVIFLIVIIFTACSPKSACNKKVSPGDVWYNKGSQRSQKAYR